MSDQPLLDQIADMPPTAEQTPRPAKVEITPESSPWRQRWEELTPYVMEYLVNRADIYGRYNKAGKPFTAKDGLAPDKITRHFRPVTPGDILGLHSTAAEEIHGPDGKLIVSCTCKWVANDIDHHGSGPAPPENALAAKAWHQRAVDLGFHPLTIQSNGAGGYRLFIVFSEPVQASIALGFIRWLQRDWAELGLQGEPEFFPRQRRIRLVDDPNDLKGACGNWVRLFGRHHKREHHSRFWTGENTVVGHAAVDWLLEHTGDDPALIPADARTFKTEHAVGRVREPAQPERPKGFDDLALATDALRSITPMAADYHAWLKVGMCLHEFGDPGLSLWEWWSKECDAKYQPGVCAAKWATFAKAGEMNGRDGLTLGWLFEVAKTQFGWRYPKTECVAERIRLESDSQSQPEAEADAPLPVPDWPDPPEREAFHGLAGEAVRMLEPSTEADAVALLLQFLVGFGNAVGRGMWAIADGQTHYPNEFVVCVGDTSRARKGTSWKRVRPVVAHADSDWAGNKITTGLSSGEGLIWEIRDPIWGTDKKTGDPKVIDAGVSDKRVLVVEPEFGSVLRVLAREGNSLSGVLRLGFDGEDLRILTKNNAARATNPHVSLIGHITTHELSAYLSAVEVHNGLGNRIMWACVRRSKHLPFGGTIGPDRIAGLGNRLGLALDSARTRGLMEWSPSGHGLWESEYEALTADRPGLWGAITARAEAHTLRLAMLFASLDRAHEIGDIHVQAALSLWRYCDRSALHLFGGSTGDPRADAILAALRTKPEGMTRSELRRRVFNDNKPAAEIACALGLLARYRMVRRDSSPTDGRPAERWFATSTRPSTLT
jgi:hypothetical protein